MTTINKANSSSSPAKTSSAPEATKKEQPKNEVRTTGYSVKSDFTPASKPAVALNAPAASENITAAAAGAGAEQGEHVRTTDALNLRTVPTTAGNDPVAVIPSGTVLQVTPDASGETRKDGFVHVTWNDAGTQRSGWVSEQYTQPSAPPNEADQEAMEQANSVYINQFAAEKQVSYTDANGATVQGDGANANCGPTSVAIALKAQGLTLPDIPGITHNGTEGADVQAARFHMYNGADSGRDGVVPVDANDPSKGYQYAPMSGAGNENSTYTGFSGVQRAVEAAGGKAEYIPANSTGVSAALDAGKAVVISGNFVEQVPVQAQPGQPQNAQGQLLDDQGNVVMQEQTKTDTWTRGGGAEEHLVAVVGKTSDGNFIVCDPAHPDSKPIVVTPAELDAFMRGNAGAMSVSK